MQSQTKCCQNCKKDFVIEPADFGFYKKIDVPPPTWCPECRLQRRYSWRNERSLHKVNCAKCQKATFSMYRGDSIFPIYCNVCWFSDSWDPLSYGRAYDAAKPFFMQLVELMSAVPQLALFHRNSMNSPFANTVADSKNIYLSYSSVGNEDVYYSKNIDQSRNILDCFFVARSDQYAYSILSGSGSNCVYCVYTAQSINSSFLYDCINCQDCFMSCNLRNKKYVFRNQQLTKEEYQNKIAKERTGGYEQWSALVKEFDQMLLSCLHRYSFSARHTPDCTGDGIFDSKNAKDVYDSYEVENVRFAVRALYLKDSYDVIASGLGSELIYEYISGGKSMRNTKFSVATHEALSDSEYTISCGTGKNLFGCVGVRNKEYCILNKQYTKEEYDKRVDQIKREMTERPYIDSRGRVYSYGEFFPMDLSPFPYNESVAQEFFQKTKEQASEQGYWWRDPEVRQVPKGAVSPDQFGDLVDDVDESVLEKTLLCAHAAGCGTHQCTIAFRIVPTELQMLKKMRIPLPRLCPNCRYYDRLRYYHPLKLSARVCDCGRKKGYVNSAKHAHGEGPCLTDFQTTYAPDRPEIVYCETCYQQEVV